MSVRVAGAIRTSGRCDLNWVRFSWCRIAESISTDTVRNCIKLLDKWCVLEVHCAPSGRQLSLRQHFDTERGVLDTIERLQDIVVP